MSPLQGPKASWGFSSLRLCPHQRSGAVCWSFNSNRQTWSTFLEHYLSGFINDYVAMQWNGIEWKGHMPLPDKMRLWRYFECPAGSPFGTGGPFFSFAHAGAACCRSIWAALAYRKRPNIVKLCKVIPHRLSNLSSTQPSALWRTLSNEALSNRSCSCLCSWAVRWFQLFPCPTGLTPGQPRECLLWSSRSFLLCDSYIPRAWENIDSVFIFACSVSYYNL